MIENLSWEFSLVLVMISFASGGLVRDWFDNWIVSTIDRHTEEVPLRDLPANVRQELRRS